MVRGGSAPGPIPSPAAAQWHCPPLSKVPSWFQHDCTHPVSQSHSTTRPPHTPRRGEELSAFTAFVPVAT